MHTASQLAADHKDFASVPAHYVATKNPSAPNPVVLNVDFGEEYAWTTGAAMLPVGSPKQEIVIGDPLIFGNAVEGSIHGFKFIDTNGDGVYEPPADVPHAGVEFQPAGDSDGDGQPDTLTMLTDANGEFWFENLFPGDYTLSEVITAPYLATTANGRDGIRLTITSGQELVWTPGAAMLGAIFSASLDLSTLDGTIGFVINGIDADDRSGRSVSGAGDVNGDGIDDLVIGAYRADPNGNYSAGESCVVFGRTTGFSAFQGRRSRVRVLRRPWKAIVHVLKQSLAKKRMSLFNASD